MRDSRRVCAVIALLLALASASSHAQSGAGVQLLGTLPLPSDLFMTDVAVESGYAYVGGMTVKRDSSGFFVFSDGRVYIVDARHPESGLQVAAIYVPSLNPPPAVIDVQIRRNLLFAALDTGGLSIVDVSDKANPREVALHSIPGGVHDVFVGENHAYLALNARAGLVILDITDPTQPREVAFYRPARFQFPHDMTVVGNRLYLANIAGQPAGFEILDVTNPAQPQLLASQAYAAAHTHNIWPSPRGTHVATSDEICPDGHLRIWDIRDLSNIVQISEYRPAEQASITTSIHNAKWVGDLIFMSYYKLGLRIVDVRDPSHPQEIARFDTASPQELADDFCLWGAWGVDTELASDGMHIYISDIQNGLWVFRLPPPEGGRRRAIRR